MVDPNFLEAKAVRHAAHLVLVHKTRAALSFEGQQYSYKIEFGLITDLKDLFATHMMGLEYNSEAYCRLLELKHSGLALSGGPS